MFTKKDTFNPILNPSDEKLREIIAEKDAEIERLKTDRDNWKGRAIENSWPFEWQVASEPAAENKRLREEIQKLKTSDWAGVTETLTKSLIEKDAEIARLKQDAERYRKLQRMLTISTPERFDAFVDAAQEVQS